MHHKLCFGSRVWHLAVIAFTVACLQAVSAQVVCTGVDQSIADEVGANWIHVRYTPTDWHPAKDRLDGWSAYGSKGNNSAPWSIQFDNMDFGEFLFVSGDCSKWLIASRFDVTGEEYGTALRTVMKSSASSTPYSASWSNRGLQQDPIVKISAAPEDVVYMANAQPSPNTAKVGGFSVYIRGRACPDGYALTYNADNVINRHGCIAGVTCDGVVDSVSGRCWKYFAANGVDHPRQEDAETACETWGGFLASILNPDDRAFADRLMIEHGVEVPQAVWVGLKACPGGWCWSDGTPFSFTQLWDSGFGQPEPRPCAVVWRRQGLPIRMMTRFCDLSIWDEDFWRRYTTAGFLCASPSSGCPDNTYGLGNGNCQLCPAGAISVAGLNKAVYSCLCPAGSALIFGASEAGCVSHPTCRGIFDPVRQRCWRSYAGLEQDWATAESTCQGDGGHLASILTPEDRTVALALYRDAGLSAGSRLWTGLHISSGAWQWSEGSAYSLIFWDGGWGEPRQGGGACAQIWERRPNTGVSMSVMHCESEFGFLCTTAAAACPDGEYGDGLRCQQCPMNGTSTEGRNMHVYNCLCPRGMAMRYTGDAGAAEATCIEHPTCVGLLDVRSNRCWKLFLEEEEWSAAEGSCNSWGGHLASITTSEDRELARELLRSAGTLTGSLLWVGLRITSTWGWSDGSLFSLNLWDGGWGEPISGRSCAMVWERRPGTNVNFGTKNCEMTFSFLCATAAPVCPDNTYGDGRRCIACPGGGTSTAGRNLLVEACVCPTGFALSQAECVVSSWCNGLLAAGRCWGYLHGNQPWETAEMACQAWNHEGHLASMSDSVERATAIQLYKANANVQWDKVWVGLSRLEDPSYWQWADDTPPLWLPWDAGWGQLTINKPCSAAWTRLAQGNAMNLIRLNCDDVSVTGSLCNTPAPTCPADTFGTWPTCVPCPSNSTSAAGRNAAIFGCRCLGGLVMDHFDETCVNVSLCSEGVFDPWEQRCWTALSSNVLTWEAARDACEVWGGDLAPVRTSWELEMAGAIYKSLGNKARNSMWVGARRSQGSVVWTWADGSPHIVNPLTWDSAPASGTSERCGVLWSQGTLALQYSDGEAKLQDLDCEDSHGYVTGALCSTRPLCPDNSFWNSAERSCSLCPNGGTSTQGRNYGVFSCRCPDLQSLAYNNLIEGIFLVECLYEPECSGGVQDVTKGVCVQYTPAEKVATADGPATRRMKVTSGGITLAASLDGCSAQGMMLLDVTGGDETLVLPALLLDAEGLGVGEAVWINGSTEADTCTVLKRDLDGSPVIEELECAAAMAAGYICSRNVAVKNAVAYEVVHSSCPGCTFIKTLTPTQELKPGTLLRQGICDASCSVLDLARKGISAISGAFRDLPNVWSLDLSMNVIRELNSGTFESMTNLVALDVSGNGMYSIELGALGPLSNLEIFWLNNNEVSYFETGLLYPLLKVREMRLAENPFICQPLFPPSLERLDVNFLAASLPNCLPPQCAGQRSAEVFSVKDFRIGARAVEQVMAMVRADAAKLLDEANLARGMYVKELGDHAFRRCWCLESLECFDILPLSNTSNVRVSVGEAWERSAPKRIKLKASAVLVGITLARFDSRAQDKFKEQAAKLYPGKTKRDIIITGKKEVRSEQGGRRALLAQVGVQVDYEVEGFESEEAVVEAVREVEEQIPELVTRLQAEKEFQQLVEINVFETPPAQGPGDGTCTDGRLNNEEVKVDCGGPDCPPCPCTADESHVCHMQAWCSATTEVQSFPTGAVIDPEIAQWPPASSTGRFECGCDAGFVGHGYGPQGCDGKAWAVRVVYQGVLASSLSTAGEANLLLLMGGLTCTRGTDGSEARCDHMHYAPTEGGLGVNVLFRASEAGHAAAEAAAVALNAALDTPAPQRRAGAVPPEVDPRLGARVYRWTMGSAGSPVAVLPSGMEVEGVHFKADCAESGCWVLHLTYTTGSSDARLETFNTFFLPYAVGSDALSHDYTYSARVLDTFQPANFPCRVSDYVGIGGSVASLPVRATGCCFGTAFNASVSALGGDATGRGLLGRYRPTEAFASYAAYAYAELCPGGFDAPDIQTSGASPTPKPEEVFPDGRARAGNHHAGSFLAAGQRFVGMHASPGVVATRAMDAWVGHFEATIEVDERELRTRAGLLRGTIGVEHSVDFFLGFASLKPAATSWVLDSLATQTAIHVEKTSFFSVSTHGVNQYTFLEYVNLRLVAVYEEDGDLSGASEATNRTVRTNPEGAASYVQITFTLGSQYQPNMASGGLIPVDSVRAGTGTFFDEVDEAGGMQQVCSVFDAAPPSAEVGLAGYSDAKSKFMGLVGQGCGPQASMCTTPGSLPDKFVSYNIPLGFEVFANKASGDLSGNIFVDLVVNALDTDPSTGGGAGPTPNEGDDPMQMKTTLTASIPIVAGGINIFCDDLTAKTDLKDVNTHPCPPPFPTAPCCELSSYAEACSRRVTASERAI